MLYAKADFKRKEAEIETTDCVVEKVIRLSGAEFDHFSRNLLRDSDFIRDNQFDTTHDAEGRTRCMLIVGEGRRDGILVSSGGYDYARYSAIMPNAEDFLTIGRYPALAELNKKLTAIVDIIAEQGAAGNPEGRVAIDLQDHEVLYEVDNTPNAILIDTVLAMLEDRPEIKDVELDGNELIIYSEPEVVSNAEGLADPTTTLTDKDEKTSVLDLIKASRQALGQPGKDASSRRKNRNEAEL